MEVKVTGAHPSRAQLGLKGSRRPTAACLTCLRQSSAHRSFICRPSSGQGVETLQASYDLKTVNLTLGRLLQANQLHDVQQTVGSTEKAVTGLATKQSTPAVRFAVGAVNIYKGFISPILPNVCRFLPSCSTYSVEAFTEFGFGKGLTLMIWRILRCNPFGGSGYDPVKWPPVGLERLFKDT